VINSTPYLASMHPQHPEEMDVLMLHCKHLAFWIFSRIIVSF